MKQALLTVITRQITLPYLETTGDRRTLLLDDIVLRFRGPTKAY